MLVATVLQKLIEEEWLFLNCMYVLAILLFSKIHLISDTYDIEVLCEEVVCIGGHECIDERSVRDQL